MSIGSLIIRGVRNIGREGLRERLILHQTNRIPLFVVPCVVHWYKQTCFQSQQSKANWMLRHFWLTSECNQCTVVWSKWEEK